VTPVGSLAIVLHTHLPWLPGHGRWPVGEEWLYQAWSGSYLRLVDLLQALAGRGQRDVLTLSVSPTIAAMLDDPQCLTAAHTWLADWQLRAIGMGAERDPVRRATGHREYLQATRALATFESRWQRGASSLLRGLADAGTVELLAGPLMHPFQPLLRPATRRAALAWGLQDATLRRGDRPGGIWAPECGYAPGLEQDYARAGVTHLMVDGPTMLAAGHDTFTGRTIGSTSVVAFARDLEVTYRVWSPRRGYPGGRWYRDFHTFDHQWGMRPARVTSRTTPPEHKAPYDPQRAQAAVRADAADFVGVVRDRLIGSGHSRPLVVVGYDTELFGHWWHEGPDWLAEVLRLLPAAQIRTTTLATAIQDGQVAGPALLPAGSWGSGKDWRVWDGAQVADLVGVNEELQARALDLVRRELSRAGAMGQRQPALDEVMRQLLLTLSSDWAFMVTKDSAADYARRRAGEHARRTRELMDGIDAGADLARTASASGTDRCFPHLDARLLTGLDH
jgi:1,4-alpha-glucan branching enzyme